MAWETVSYDDFLPGRRPLTAAVVRDGFSKLTQDSYAPTYPAPGFVSDHDTDVTTLPAIRIQ